MAAWTIRERKKQQRGQVFLILNFDVYINVDNRESANARMKKKKKKKEDQFRWKKLACSHRLSTFS